MWLLLGIWRDTLILDLHCSVTPVKCGGTGSEVFRILSVFILLKNARTQTLCSVVAMT